MRRTLLLVLITLVPLLSTSAQKNRYGMKLKQDGENYTLSNELKITPLLEQENKVLPADAYQLYKYTPSLITTDDYSYCTTDTLTYKTYPDKGYSLKMKVDIPTGELVGDGPYPFIIWVHGGGWSGGGPDSFKKQSKYLASRGIAGIRIGYSLGRKGGKFELAMEDIADVYQLVMDSAEQWNLDMSRFGYAGGSAGTPLASLSAMLHDSDSCKVFIGCNGIYDFENNRTGIFCREGSKNKYLSNITDEKSISAIAHIPDNASHIPNAIFFHGTADFTISHLQSTSFEEAIIGKGGVAKTYLYENYVHAFFNPNFSDAFENVTMTMYDFAAEIFNTPKISYHTQFCQ